MMRAILLSCFFLFIYSSLLSQEESPDVRIARATIQIRQQPDSAAGYINRSRAYNDKNLFDLALKDCASALKLSPINPFAIKQRGFAYLNKQLLYSA